MGRRASCQSHDVVVQHRPDLINLHYPSEVDESQLILHSILTLPDAHGHLAKDDLESGIVPRLSKLPIFTYGLASLFVRQLSSFSTPVDTCDSSPRRSPRITWHDVHSTALMIPTDIRARGRMLPQPCRLQASMPRVGFRRRSLAESRVTSSSPAEPTNCNQESMQVQCWSLQFFSRRAARSLNVAMARRVVGPQRGR